MTQRSQKVSRRRACDTSAIGLYSEFSLGSALVYCASLMVQSVARPRARHTDIATGAPVLNGEFIRVSAGH